MEKLAFVIFLTSCDELVLSVTLPNLSSLNITMQTLALKKKRNFMNFTSTSSTSYMLIILVNCFKYNLGNVEKPREKKKILVYLLRFWIGNLESLPDWLAK